MLPLDAYMPLQEAVEHLKLTRGQVAYLCREGKLEGAQMFGNTWAIPKTSVENYTPSQKGAPRTIRPEKPVSELIVKVEGTGGDVLIRTRQRDEKVSVMLRRLGFSYSNGWRIPAMANVDDRAVEAAANLVAMGYIVQMPTAAMAKRVVNAEYTPVATKTISARDGMFTISWHFSDGDYYREAREIYGSRWDSGHKCVNVPAEKFADVLDFAELQGFTLTPAARRLAEEADALRRDALTPKASPKVVAEPEPEDAYESLLDED